MEEWERQQYLSRNSEVINQVAEMEAAFHRQQGEMAEALRKLGQARIRVKSADRLVELVANTSGIVTELSLSPDAFRHNTPERLARSINEAIQAGAAAAARAREEYLAPVIEAAGDVPDLDELIPGAPSLRQWRDQLSGQAPTPPKPEAR
ncbi:MAG: YbaB/EbfC family nucleoid-associated protein [Mycobacteriaceae bacterium]|nr:YbaB/EbfC family nucleoid-associated protein [Mycobacteriaceae bacterium]